jgi:site-specific recombinase XerD
MGTPSRQGCEGRWPAPARPGDPAQPHVLRHACASRLYAEGLSLLAVQQLLGHRWLSTTMRYVHVAEGAIELEYQQAAERAASRFKEG